MKDLSDHVQQLVEEERRWRAKPPDDVSEFCKKLYTADGLIRRKKAAEGVRTEINEAIKVLRAAGYID